MVKKWALFGALLAGALVVASCGSSGGSASETQSPANSSESNSASGGNTGAATKSAPGESSEPAAPSGGVPTATIGAVYTLSGFAAVFGQDQLDGVKLAIQQLKNQGIADLKLSEADAGASPATALNAFRKVAADDPIAVMAPIVGPFVNAILPDAASDEIPTITTASTPENTGNKWLFRNFWSQSMSVKAGAQYATGDLKAKRIAILADNTDFGQGFATDLKPAVEAGGGEIVANESTEQNPLDIAGQVSRIVSAKPDITFVQLQTGSPLAQAIKALRDGGYDGTIFAAPGMTSPSTLDLLSGEQVDGIYAATMALDSSSDKVKAFIADYQAMSGNTPDVYAANAYDTTMEIGQAVASGVKTTADLWTYLSDTEYVGLATTYQADNNGDMGHVVDIVSIDKDKKDQKVGQIKLNFTKRNG